MIHKLDSQIEEYEKKLKDLRTKKNAELKKTEDSVRKHVGNYMMKLFEDEKEAGGELKSALESIKAKLLSHYKNNKSAIESLNIYFSK